MKFISVLTLSLLAAAASFADEAVVPGRSNLSIGAGVAMPGMPGETVNALFRVESELKGPRGRYSEYVWAKISADVAGGTNGVSYLDIQFDVLGARIGAGDNYAGLTTLGLDIQRDVRVNNNLTARVTLIGLRGSVSGAVSDTVEAYLKGTADVLSMALSYRRGDQSGGGGWGPGASGEFGLKIFKRVRIAIGEKLGFMFDAPEDIYTGVSCYNYYDSYGYLYTDCRDTYATRFRERRVQSNTYLSAAFALTKHLEIFGQANYNVYILKDETGRYVDSANGAFKLLLGVAGRF